MARKEKYLQFKVLIEQDEDGVFVASVPELPGCYTQAKSLEVVRRRIKEAIELVLETDQDLVKKKSKQRFPSTPRFFGVEDVMINYA